MDVAEDTLGEHAFCRSILEIAEVYCDQPPAGQVPTGAEHASFLEHLLERICGVKGRGGGVQAADGVRGGMQAADGVGGGTARGLRAFADVRRCKVAPPDSKRGHQRRNSMPIVDLTPAQTRDAAIAAQVAAHVAMAAAVAAQAACRQAGAIAYWKPPPPAPATRSIDLILSHALAGLPDEHASSARTRLSCAIPGHAWWCITPFPASYSS